MANPRLVVMRLADMQRVHPQQDDSKVCAVCGQQVGIYPSGQEALKHDPTMEIVCSVCNEADHDPWVGTLAPGALREPFESVANPRKKG